MIRIQWRTIQAAPSAPPPNVTYLKINETGWSKKNEIKQSFLQDYLARSFIRLNT